MPSYASGIAGHPIVAIESTRRWAKASTPVEVFSAAVGAARIGTDTTPG
jgi:hypothetical protein